MTHDKWVIFCHAYAAVTRELAWSNEDQYLVTVVWEHDLFGDLRFFETNAEATYEGLPQAFSEILMMDLEFATFGQNVTIEVHALAANGVDSQRPHQPVVTPEQLNQLQALLGVEK